MTSRDEQDTTFRDRQERLLFEALMLLIARQCPDPRRCARVGCRRSGRSVRKAEALRSKGPRPLPSAPAPRRARSS